MEHECEGADCMCHQPPHIARPYFEQRGRELAAKIRALPQQEQVRAAADFLEMGWKQHALGLLRAVVSRLENEVESR